MLVFTRFCVSLCCCANSHFSICAFLRVILLSANITVPYRTCHPVKCQYYSATSYVSSCQVPILQCHILRVILSSANITVPYRAFFLPSVNIRVPHSTCHPVECQYYSAISYVSSCQVPILQCHILRVILSSANITVPYRAFFLPSVNITVPHSTSHPVKCQYYSAISYVSSCRVPIYQCHTAVCYCVRSPVSSGKSMYCVKFLYAGMHAVFVLCVCCSHISVRYVVVPIFMCKLTFTLYVSFLCLNINWLS